MINWSQTNTRIRLFLKNKITFCRASVLQHSNEYTYFWQIYCNKLKAPNKPHSSINSGTQSQLSRLITMNYAFTKSICIPAGTGSGMVIPVSSLCFKKTEGLWCLFLLFLPSLSVIQSSPGTQVTHTLQWARQQKSLTKPSRSSRREALSESVIRWRDKRMRWCWKRSYSFMMRLMDWLNLLSSDVHRRNTECTEMTNDWPNFRHFIWHLVVSNQSFSHPHSEPH